MKNIRRGGAYSRPKKENASKFERYPKKNTKPRPPKRPSFVKNEQSHEQEDDGLKLIGRNAVLEALSGGGDIDRILLRKPEEGTQLEGSLRVIAAKAKERGIVISEVTKEKLDATTADNTNHQGVIALCPAFPYSTVEEIIEFAHQKNEPPFIVVLDEVSDPHNLGAVIRTAECVGAHGVIIPKRRACGLTSTAARSAAGAAAYVKIARVTNIVSVLEQLKKQNIWVACADITGEPLYETKAPLDGAIAVVFGAEGGGVPLLVKKTCDFSVKIPMLGSISSLNVSVSAGVVLYEIVRRKGGK
ncbi:MAG: 23S rRNA (guanosine(2251)-2'-O)-methyltransferase RlmB [Clostridiales bacterium]|jgi:23S rRNA (guanosine2251-2'-O)-methyltransferase|nr:23S rRNA (guanosine(2251)-2'-O)-methyltransferase RlmB [Clostridiales bacterium]